MKSKEYLLQVQKLDRMIENKLEEVEHWKNIATSTAISSDGERVQSSGSKEKMADTVCKYLTMESEINAVIDKLVDTRQEIIETIELLNADEYDLLYKMYVGIRKVRKDGTQETMYLTLDEVAALKDRSKRWAASVHGRALASLQKILDEKEQHGSKEI